MAVLKTRKYNDKNIVGVRQVGIRTKAARNKSAYMVLTAAVIAMPTYDLETLMHCSEM